MTAQQSTYGSCIVMHERGGALDRIGYTGPDHGDSAAGERIPTAQHLRTDYRSVGTHYNFKKAADEVCRARKNIWIDAIRTMQLTTRWRRRRGP